jgi:hypothetical protein
VTTTEKPADVRAAVEALRAPFPEDTIGKLPRVTCQRCRGSQSKKCDDHSWISACDQCRGGHTSAVIHLDYVGHAAVTDRLLAVDPAWSWEPLAVGPDGLPAHDPAGNLWIRLTVCGITRIGVGDADGGNSPKVKIGDAIRNAAMRFGVALDLWAKEDLGPVNPRTDPVFLRMMLDNIGEASTREELADVATRLRQNPGLLSLEDRDRVNQAWIERRDKMGHPA